MKMKIPILMQEIKACINITKMLNNIAYLAQCYSLSQKRRVPCVGSNNYLI